MRNEHGRALADTRPAAEVPGIDIAGEYGNATELMPSLAESEDVASCVARQ